MLKNLTLWECWSWIYLHLVIVLWPHWGNEIWLWKMGLWMKNWKVTSAVRNVIKLWKVNYPTFKYKVASSWNRHRFLKWSLPQSLSHQYFVYLSHFFQGCYTFCPFHPSWLNQQTKLWKNINFESLYTIFSSLMLFHFSQHLVFKDPFSHTAADQNFTPKYNNWYIYSFKSWNFVCW